MICQIFILCPQSPIQPELKVRMQMTARAEGYEGPVKESSRTCPSAYGSGRRKVRSNGTEKSAEDLQCQTWCNASAVLEITKVGYKKSSLPIPDCNEQGKYDQ